MDKAQGVWKEGEQPSRLAELSAFEAGMACLVSKHIEPQVGDLKLLQYNTRLRRCLLACCSCPVTP